MLTAAASLLRAAGKALPVAVRRTHATSSISASMLSMAASKGGARPDGLQIGALYRWAMARSLSSTPTACATAPPVTLNTISDLPGAKKKARRVGRGFGSGKGRTAGRGLKGQKARSGSGKPKPAFEGGQTPMYRRMPKRGFVNKFAQPLAEVNLSRIQLLIDQGRLDQTQPIRIAELVKSGAVTGNVKHGIKLLARGAEYFNAKVDLEVSWASKRAEEAVEKAGGVVRKVYYNRLGLRVLLHPEKFDPKLTPRFAAPPPKLWHRYPDQLPQAVKDALQQREAAVEKQHAA
eukprot:tig00000203_g17140.t1